MIVVSGPSCVGKSMMVTKLVDYYQYETIKPLTSRRKRRDEVGTLEYTFVNYSKLRDLMKKKNSGFWDIPVKRDIYGYLRHDIESAIKINRVVIQAASRIAIQLKNNFQNVTLVFLDYETESEKIRRMNERFPDKSELMNRLMHTRLERTNAAEFDHILISDSPNDFIKLLKKENILSITETPHAIRK